MSLDIADNLLENIADGIDNNTDTNNPADDVLDTKDNSKESVDNNNAAQETNRVANSDTVNNNDADKNKGVVVEDEIAFVKEKLKELAGVEISKIEDIKQYIDSVNEYKSKLEELTKEKDKYAKALESIDTSKLFANEELARLNSIMKKFPNLPPHLASRIISSDLNKMDKLQAIALAERLEDPELDISDEEIINALFNDLPEDPSEWSAADKYKISKMFKEAVKKIEDIRSTAVENFDITTLLDENKEAKEQYIQKLKDVNSKQVKNVVEEVVKEGLKIKLKNTDNEDVVYEFKFNPNDLEEYYTSLLNDTIEAGILIDSEDAIRDLRETVIEDFKLKYFDKIITDYATQLLTEYKEKINIELHNPKVMQGGQTNQEDDYSKEIFESMF